jgi:putative restriction endonuclease
MVNHVERAYRAWPILTNQAKKNETITYGQLAKHLNMHHRPVRYVLGVIQAYGMENRLPPLTINVVRGDNPAPSSGFIAWDMEDLDRGRAEVHAYPWDSLDNPFAFAADGTAETDIVDRLRRHPDDAAEVFAKVRVRGMAQIIFRKLLLEIYEGRCALCGLTFEDALEASHLIPWSEATPKQRLDPRNGILLCATHHRLFDAGEITISRAGVVTYIDPNQTDGSYSNSDKFATVRLHGKKAFIPESVLHRPADQSLAHHHSIHKWGDLP